MGLRVKLVFGFILFCIIFGLRIFCASCQHVDEINDDDEDYRSRQHSQAWYMTSTHANIDFSSTETYLKNFQDTLSYSNENQQLRRRKPGLRKRKRRPQGYTTDYSIDSREREHWRSHVQGDLVDCHNENQDIAFSTDISSTLSSPSAPLRNNWKIHSTFRPPTKFPERTAERIREPLAALEKEQKLFELRDKQRKELESETDVTNQPAINLKSILKNSGRLSLSEILQQKNLSLDDLLKGKQNALQALQMSTPSDIIENDAAYRYTKPNRRIPWNYSRSSTTTESNPPTIEDVQTIPPNENKFELNSNRNYLKSRFSTQKPFTNGTDNNPPKTPQKSGEALGNTSKIVELATIVTLRDNPPLKKSQNKPVKNIIFPSIPKSKIFRSSTAKAPQTKPEKIEETKKIEKEITHIVDGIESTSNGPRNFLRNYQQNLKFKTQQSIRTTQSTPLLLSSFSFSPQQTFSEEKNEDSKLEKVTKNWPQQGTTSQENRNSQESVEEKLRKTGLHINYVHKFSSYDNIDSEETTKLEDLFDFSVQKPKGQEMKHQIITPRIDKFIDNIQNKPFFSTEKFDVTETNPSLFVDLTSYQSDDDHTDILELIEDRRSSTRLFKILAQRNMTLEQLIEHRRRGSSQLHLAEIVYNKTTIKPTIPKQRQQQQQQRLSNSNSISGRVDIVTAFENFPQFNLADLKSIKPDEIKTDSEGSSYFTSIIDIEPTDEIYKEDRSLQILLDTEPKIQSRQQQRSVSKSKTPLIQQNLKNFPSWRTQEDNDISENSNTDNRNNPVLSSPHLSLSKETIIDNTVIKIEDEVARAHDLLELELSGHGFKRNEITIDNNHGNQITPGIRSAIVASTLIVIISLTIFLFIFVICRWKHRRKNKLTTYQDTFNAIKTRLPIISSGQTTTTTNTMNNNNSNSTMIFSGSKNKLNTMDTNSPEVQEYLYDAIRKQF